MNKRRIGLMTALGCTLAVCAHAASSTLFSPQQLADIRATRLQLVAPRMLPPGFHVHGVYVEPELVHTPDVSYAILYVGPNSACIVTEVAGGGIGDMIIQDDAGNTIKPTKQLRNPTLGTTAFWNTRAYLGTDWFYHPTTSKTGPFVSVRGDIDRTSVQQLDPKAAALCHRAPAEQIEAFAVSLEAAPLR